MYTKRIILASFLIILGGLLLVQIVFNINMHIWGTAFALALVFLGVSLIMKPSRRPAEPGQPYTQYNFGTDQRWFSNGYFDMGSDDGSHEAFFSNTQARIASDAPPNVDVQAVFSAVTLYVPTNRRVNLFMECAFGVIYPPDGVQVSFGNGSALFGEGEILNLRVSCVFGSVTVHTYEGSNGA